MIHTVDSTDGSPGRHAASATETDGQDGDARIISYRSNGRLYVSDRENDDAWIFAGAAACLEEMQ